ncbi:MAG: hypothetical protein H6707_13905 [Deltaproteobacteria bacterium]|nr:hypothetical protein [Deltaproteobacteria bacterium]
MSWPGFFGVFLISCATLIAQLAWTRILSISLWYHFAFLVVSTAMLGFGGAAATYAVSRRLAALSLSALLAGSALALSVAALGGLLLTNAVPFAPFSLLESPVQLLYGALYVVAITAPFFCAGLVITALFSRVHQQAGRIYAWDLVGAGLGCLLALPLLGLGPVRALLSAALVAACAAPLFAGSGRRLHYGLPALLFGALLLLPVGWLEPSITPTKRLGGQPVQELLKRGMSSRTLHNAFSRVDVMPAAWGKRIVIDAGTAVTRLPRLDAAALKAPLTDERQLVLRAQQQRVLIIGSGGGWEVAAALRSQARRVVAVEINGLINRLVTERFADYTARIFLHPAVELHTAEARSYIRREQRQFDAILAAHTITNAAAASGAMSLAEEYVLTVEAIGDYIDRLAGSGRLFISRPEAQLPRLVATAVEALARRSLSAAERVVVFAGRPAPNFYGAVVVTRAPIIGSERAWMRRVLIDQRLRPLYLPGSRAPTVFRRLVTANAVDREALYRASRTRLAPATDDRPFFNHRSRFSQLNVRQVAQVFRQGQLARAAVEAAPVAEAVLIALLVESLVFALALIALPLLRRRTRAGAALLPLTFFFLIGLSFIFVESALIQSFALFIGQPVHAFAVVVGSLLICAGIGSSLSGRLADRRLPWVLGAAALAIGVFALTAPRLISLALGAALPWRVFVAVGMLAPMALLMGVPLPTMIARLGRESAAAIPWAWGANAIASVVGAVLAVIIATELGFSGVLISAAALYLVGAMIAFGLLRRDGTKL